MGGETADSLAGYLSLQLDELEKQLPLVASEPEAVHDARVALRRFRSAASCFGPLLPALPADDVGHLRTLARHLGEARDEQVLAQRLAAAVEGHGPWKKPEALRDLAAGLAANAVSQAAAVAARERAAIAADRRRLDLAAIRNALGSNSQGWEAANLSAARDRLQLRWVRLQDLMEQSRQSASAEGHDNDLHNVRKALKYLRYASEAAAGGFNGATSALVQPATALQRLLGEQHDAVTARGTLAEASQAGAVDADDAAALDRLEQTRAAEAESAFYRTAAEQPVPEPAKVLA